MKEERDAAAGGGGGTEHQILSKLSEDNRMKGIELPHKGFIV